MDASIKENTFFNPFTVETWKNIEKILLDVVEKENIKDFEGISELYRALMNEAQGEAIRDKKKRPKFDSLKSAIEKFPNFYSEIFPSIVKRALLFPSLHSTELKYLFVGMNDVNKLSRTYVAVLMSLLFLSVINWNHHGGKDFPSIHFSFFANNGDQEIAKVIMIIHYFDRIKSLDTIPGFLYIRRTAESIDESFWLSKAKLLPVQIEKKGSIEDGKESLHADFANEYLGGGVLSGGCVQEEIKFSVCPELISAMIFCEKMSDHEAIIITGSEQFSEYKGYGFSLLYGGDHVDSTERDKEGSLLSSLTCYDALYFQITKGQTAYQFEKMALLRELNKSYVAFKENGGECSKLTYPKICTGNWGCGVFNGDHQLKFIVQWISATLAGREMLYYTFGNGRLNQSNLFVEHILKKEVTIENLFQATLSAIEAKKGGKDAAIFDLVASELVKMESMEK